VCVCGASDLLKIIGEIASGFFETLFDLLTGETAFLKHEFNM